MIALLIMLFLTFGYTHDLWLEKVGDRIVLYYGHIKPKEGEEGLISYKAENVLKAMCFNKEAKRVEVQIERVYPLSFPANCFAYYVLFSTGYWTKTIKGTKNLPKDKAEGPLESWLSYEGVKRLESWTETFKRPLTEDLEIVPLEDPFSVSLNSKISLKVYYRGKPVKGAVVAYQGRVVGSTDEEGNINVRIKEKGLQRISASIKEKSDGLKADYTVISTNLIFEVR
ncbi:MAG: DUF4198 domain-containing protein [Aquificaceae bacterium]